MGGEGGEMLILQGAGGMGAETVNVKGAEGGVLSRNRLFSCFGS